MPKFEGHTNWDHPSALHLDRLAKDLAELSQGKSVIISTKNEWRNSDYKRTNKRISLKFQPKPIMFVEGCLVFLTSESENFLALQFFLTLTMTQDGRVAYILSILQYEEKVLLPMHKQFVEPTKQYSAHIINVSHLSKEHILEKVEDMIKNFLK